MPLQATSGAASYDAFGGGVPVAINYIEEVFSTYLYTGNDSTQTITNGIDLSGKGGMTWIKSRNEAFAQRLFDTVRGATYFLVPNTTDASTLDTSSLTAFNSNGFSLGSEYRVNAANTTYASWTFRKQPKFFDVVTWVGNNTARTISHNLGSVPGCIIVKNTENTSSWTVYHQSLGNTKHLNLNETASEFTSTSWNNTTPTSTEFTIGSLNNVNASGDDFVAYVFAHNAGGFGLTGTDNVISCGSFTTDGSGNATVSLGYEPQWVLMKSSSAVAGWQLVDVMRGMSQTQVNALVPNTSAAEGSAASNYWFPTATGFELTNGWAIAGATYIYIAIRRGPMKVPTVGTSVFYPNAYSGTGVDTTITSTGFAPDLFFSKARSFDSLYLNVMVDRLRGASQFLVPTNTIAETVGTNVVLSLNMNGVTVGSGSNANSGTVTYVQWNFKRAPSFFDEVCYTSTAGFAASFTHNLGVTPELIIFKNRQTGGGSGEWTVYSSGTGNNQNLALNTTAAAVTQSGFIQTLNSTTVLTGAVLPQANQNYVSYLFATCAGVSKVGSYTGTGATQTINCGFGASGSRFVLVKRTDSTGDWYVWDSARGMVSGTDPSLLLNSTAAEVNANSVYAVSTGFQIVSTAAGINASGGSYIFLSVA
jgi:hypothetical protein